MRRDSDMKVIVPVLVITSLCACASKEWSKEGVSQDIKARDLETCKQLATSEAREEIPRLLVHSSTTTTGTNSSVMLRDINEDKFNRARVKYFQDCMLEKDYHIE